MTEDIIKIKEKVDKAYTKYTNLRDKYNELKVKELTDKYVGKYIKFSTTSNYLLDSVELTYMYVKNIWESEQENRIYFEGMTFSRFFSDYDDCTYFSWQAEGQEWMTSRDAHNDKWCNVHIAIIPYEEFKETFNKNICETTKRFLTNNLSDEE